MATKTLPGLKKPKVKKPIQKTVSTASAAEQGRKFGGKTSTSGQGRVKGVPNRSTTEARAAIAAFVDGNAHRLQAWLDQVADGIPMKTPEGVVVTSRETGQTLWQSEPNPEKAFDMFHKVIEYHVPKLQRTVVVGEPENPVGLEHSSKQLSKEDLQAELERRGLPTTLLTD